GRLGRGDRKPDAARPLALPDRLPVDPAALLGARAADPPRLRGGAHSDAARRARRAGDDAADRHLFARPGGRHAGARPVGNTRARLPRCGDRAGSDLPVARTRPAPADDAATRVGALPLLTPLPGAALRR